MRVLILGSQFERGALELLQRDIATTLNDYGVTVTVILSNTNSDSRKKEDLKFKDLELIFKDLKSLFEKRGFVINWKALQQQSLDETINALAMASPFSLEEKQILLEAKNLDDRKNLISEILKTYSFDNFDNTTIQ